MCMEGKEPSMILSGGHLLFLEYPEPYKFVTFYPKGISKFCAKTVSLDL